MSKPRTVVVSKPDPLPEIPPAVLKRFSVVADHRTVPAGLLIACLGCKAVWSASWKWPPARTLVLLDHAKTHDPTT